MSDLTAGNLFSIFTGNGLPTSQVAADTQQPNITAGLLATDGWRYDTAD